MASTEQTKEATGKKTIRSPKFIAVVQRTVGEAIHVEPEIIVASTSRELREKLLDPGLKIVACFRGRQLEFKTQQQIQLKLN